MELHGNLKSKTQAKKISYLAFEKHIENVTFLFIGLDLLLYK